MPIVLKKPAPRLFCYCLAKPGYPTPGHTGDCCDGECDRCDKGYCYCTCPPLREDYDDDYISFADPGGRSALRASTHDRCPGHHCHRKVGRTDLYCRSCGHQLNPRYLPCPDCGARGVLTPEDVALGYRCDRCSDRAERGFDY